jgi:hypothetical protein
MHPWPPKRKVYTKNRTKLVHFNASRVNIKSHPTTIHKETISYDHCWKNIFYFVNNLQFWVLKIKGLLLLLFQNPQITKSFIEGYSRFVFRTMVIWHLSKTIYQKTNFFFFTLNDGQWHLTTLRIDKPSFGSLWNYFINPLKTNGW